jgi:hypothetical protein
MTATIGAEVLGGTMREDERGQAVHEHLHRPENWRHPGGRIAQTAEHVTARIAMAEAAHEWEILDGKGHAVGVVAADAARVDGSRLLGHLGSSIESRREICGVGVRVPMHEVLVHILGGSGG